MRMAEVSVRIEFTMVRKGHVDLLVDVPESISNDPDAIRSHLDDHIPHDGIEDFGIFDSNDTEITSVELDAFMEE